MVTNVTSLTGNGLKDWLIQRITAVYFVVYMGFIAGYLLSHPDLSYTQWSNLFHCCVFQVATAIALLTLTLHSWIGLWTVTTDYLSCTMVRLSVQGFIALILISQLFAGFMIIWGR